MAAISVDLPALFGSREVCVSSKVERESLEGLEVVKADPLDHRRAILSRIGLQAT
jgi:hypothetical protein